MTEAEIDSLLAGMENDHVEFKKDLMGDELVEKKVLERTTEKRQDPSAAFRLHRRFREPEQKSSDHGKQGVLEL